MFFCGIDLAAPFYWTFDKVFSSAQCRALIRRIESLGPALATANLPAGPSVCREHRNHDRVRFEDPALAAALDRALEGKISRLQGRAPVGAHPGFRGYRYSKGQYFGRHMDAAFSTPTHRSLLTVLIYLNDSFEGGATRFPELNVEIKPAEGRALVFQHSVPHEGAEVLSGVKFAVRTNYLFELKDEGRR